MSEEKIQTNMTIKQGSALERCAKAFLEAGYDFWEEHQQACGGSAVVWLEMCNGHFLLFTRSEYKRDILGNINGLQFEKTLDHPFELPPPEDG